MTTTAALRPLGQTHLTLANPDEDIRNRKVLDSNGEEIGTVDDLLIDDDEKKVRFIQVASGGFLGLGETKFLLPVDAIVRVERASVRICRTRDRIIGAPRYDPTLLDQDYLDRLYGYYGFAPFWSAGYAYPPFPYAAVDRPFIVGVFEDRDQAEKALNELRRAGFREEQLGVLARGEKVSEGEVALEAAGKDALAGAVLGGAAGAVWGLAVVAGLIPGIGPVLAAGALAAVLTSAATGAAVVGTVGFFIGLGVPESEARQHERDLRAGRILITVRTEGRYDEAAEILQRHAAFTDPRLATPY